MKYILILLVTVAMAAGATAQKKPKLGQGEKFLAAGDYAQAKDIADRAVEHEKLKNDPKAWFLRARIYMAIDTANAGISDAPMREALASFEKAEQMGDKSKLYTQDPNSFLPILFDQHLNNYWAYYSNQGASAFKEEDFAGAADGFEKAQMISPQDTVGYVYGGFAAHNAELWDQAMASYQGAIDNGATSRNIFSSYAFILKAQKKDYDKALEIIRKGRALYPDDKELAGSEIDILMRAGKAEEAKANLERQLREEPDNANYHFIYGLLLEESGDKAGAKAAYQNAVRADPDNFNANFNLGVMLINEANEIITERNNLGISAEDLKKAGAMEPQIVAKLKQALPQWETVHWLNPSDKTAMTTLRYIYTQLKDMDKAEVMQRKIDAAGGENE